MRALLPAQRAARGLLPAQGAARALRVIGVAGLVWLLAGTPSTSQAQFETGPFAGFGIEAWGAAFSMIYDDPNGPIPAHPTGEMHAAYALATLTDGPSGHGVASEVWPGATAATAAPFIIDSVWDGMKAESDGQFPPSQIAQPAVPAGWPLAAEVFEPSGPHNSQVPPNAVASSTETRVHAKAETVPLSLPGVFTADVAGSTTDTWVDGGAATAKVVTTAADIAVAGGMIKIDEVTTTASVASDGVAPAISGQTVVTGLTINGQGFTIDADGIHAGGETRPNPITAQINTAAEQALADSGISITLASPIDTVKKAEGSRSVGGIVIRLRSTGLDEFVTQLPDEIEREVRANLSTTHDLTLIFGAANVRASAVKTFEVVFDEDDFGFDADFGSDDASVLGATVDLSGLDLAPEASPADGAQSLPAGPVTGRAGFAAPVSVDGVAVAAVLLGLALALAAARGLKVLSDTLLAAGGGGAAACPLDQDED